MNGTKGGLRTGEVAEQAGVNIQTLRYYERRGLLSEPVLDAGRRRHPAPDLRQRAIDKIGEIDAKIADLQVIRTALSQVVDARCDSLTNCTCADCPIPFLTIAAHPDGELS
jgi:MerR family transcriptional regulator, mercuric resistance operon regulatory protein